MTKRCGHEVVSYVRMPDGSRVPFEELTAEQQQNVRETVAENVGRVLGRYLSEHPEEIESLRHCGGVQLIPQKIQKSCRT